MKTLSLLLTLPLFSFLSAHIDTTPPECAASTIITASSNSNVPPSTGCAIIFDSFSSDGVCPDQQDCTFDITISIRNCSPLAFGKIYIDGVLVTTLDSNGEGVAVMPTKSLTCGSSRNTAIVVEESNGSVVGAKTLAHKCTPCPID
ncbi:MAG TPA: hypothetical protein EYN86_03305 [Planctomycetes bacterium]|nr:hypothetical protein [Planctomycetota bacterium]